MRIRRARRSSVLFAGLVMSLGLLGASAGAAHALQALPVTVTGSTSWSVATSLPPAGPSTTFFLGAKPLVPVIGDWDGNGTRTPGTYEVGVFKLSNALPPGGPTITIPFGDPRGFPVAGDFDGDGRDDLAVYRNGLWQIRVESGGTGAGGAVTPFNVTAYAGNWPSTIPVAGDWDGNGTDGIGRYAPLTGEWLLRQTTGGLDIPAFTYNPGVSPYAVVGDWDNDGDDTVGVKAGAAWLLNNQNDSSPPDINFVFGLANDLPLVGGGTGVDTPPTAVNDSATVAEDAAATAVPVLGNDTDPDGGPKAIASATDPANGSVVLTGGSPGAHTGLTYQPDPNHCNSPPGTSPDTFSYTLTPGGSTATVSITVTCVDDAPVAVANSATMNEDDPAAAVLVLNNDTDIDGGPKTIASASDPANGTVVLTGGSPGAHTGLTYQPDPNYCNTPPGTSPDTFTYTLNGGSSATVSMTVACVDDRPIAVNDSATVAANASATAVPVLTNDTDADGGPKTIVSATDPANGTVVLTGGSPGAHTGLTYQPDANYCNDPPGTSPDTFTYTLNGGSIATVSMTVTCPAVNNPPSVDNSAGALAYTENDPPTAIDTNITVTDGDSVNLTGATVQITGNYVAGQDVLALPAQPVITASFDVPTGKLTLSGTATVAAYEAALEAVTYVNTSDAPNTATRTVTYHARDAGGFGAADTHAIAITAVDDPPVAVANSAGVNEDDPAASVLVLNNDTDIDGGPKVIMSASDPANGFVVLTGGSPGAHTGLTYQPDSNYCNSPSGTPDTFSYTLNGGSSATVSMTVTCVGDNPVVNTSAGSLAYTENAPAAVIDPGVTVTDADTGASITGATVAITTNFAGAQDVLALNGVHPFITAGAQIGNTLSLTGTATPGAYQAALRDVTYRNTSEGPSTLTRTVTFTVTDNTALPGSDTRGISVTAVNDPPTAVDDVGTTDEDTALTVVAPGVLANDTDVDPGDTKTVVALNGTGTLTQSLPSGASVTINANGSYTYNPLSAFQGLSTGQSASDSFTYTMRDAANAQSTATVNLTIDGVSDAPTVVADTFDAIGNTGLFVGTTRPATQAGKEITGSVLTNDTDLDSPQASLVVQPVTNAPTSLGGTITIEADGNFTYHPDDGDTAVTDTFTYRVCDNSPCNSGTVANATGTINFDLSGQVWYVRNNEPAGGDGTSDTPFDTLVEAETASQTGDTVYVFDGNNTTTNLNTGFVMEANERLIGESRPLSLDPDGGGSLPTETLFPGTAGNVPTLTASNEDVVVLAANVTVDGFTLDPSGTGGGIAGGPGAGGGAAGGVTVSNVDVTDTGTAGTQPGIDMDGTTGTNRFTAVTVTNGGSATAIGVRLNSAGTVLFANTATNTIETSGAKALDAAGTNLSTSRWNDIRVTGSGSGAIRLNNTSGSLVLGDGAGTDLSLQTTSGATAALDIASSNNVSVNGGTATISATGGPAVDIRNSNGSLYGFDSVSSTNSAGDGINLDTNLATPFTAITGTISGAAGIAVDVNGGGAGGDVSYGGAINDGSGPLSVEVAGRTGGAVTFSGNIGDGPDTGGGIALSANTAGTTTFSGSAKVLNTGGSPAVSATSSAASSALSFTNGGLDIDATSGAGFDAATGGTISVEGTANTIDTTTGRALRIQNSPIAATDVTLQRVSSNGAPNGILLDTTTNATGRLIVTGNSATCTPATPTCTGGAIQNSSGAGISLTSVPGGASLTRMAVTGGLDDGIRATTVNDLDVADSIVTNNGNSHAGGAEERGLDYLNVTGSPQILRTMVSGSDDSNAHIRNTAAGTTTLSVDASTFSGSKFNAGLRLRGEGPSVMTANVVNSFFPLNADPGFSMQTDSANTAQQTLLFNNNEVSGGSSNAVSARPQVSINVDSASIVKATLTNNKIKSAAGSEVILNTLENHTGTFDAEFNNNSIGDAQPGVLDALADGGSSIHGWAHGDGITRVEIRSNTVQNWGGRAMELSHNTGNGSADYTLTGNVVSNPDATANTFEGIYIFSGAGNAAGDTSDVCIDAEGNDFDGIGRQGVGDIGFDRDTLSFLRFADYNATTVAGLQSNLRAKNPASPALTVDQFGNPVTATADLACDLPVGTP